MGTLACYFAIVEYDDLIGVHDGTDPLCHDENGGVLGICFERSP